MLMLSYHCMKVKANCCVPVVSLNFLLQFFFILETGFLGSPP